MQEEIRWRFRIRRGGESRRTFRRTAFHPLAFTCRARNTTTGWQVARVLYSFLSSGFAEEKDTRTTGHPSVERSFRSGPQLPRGVPCGMRRVRSLSDGIIDREAKCHTIGSGNNNSDSAGGWRFAVANCCETTTFWRRFVARSVIQGPRTTKTAIHRFEVTRCNETWRVMNFLWQKRVVLTMWRESGDAPALVFIMFAQTVICLFRKWNIKHTYYSRLYFNIFAKTANLWNWMDGTICLRLSTKYLITGQNQKKPIIIRRSPRLNKDVKHYYEFNTRKCSRINTSEDLMHKLFISSDPYKSIFHFIYPAVFLPSDHH